MDTRFFVQKKEAFRTEGQSLKKELIQSLGLSASFDLKRYNIYDIFDADESDIELLKTSVCSEVVTDTVYDSVDVSDKDYLALSKY